MANEIPRRDESELEAYQTGREMLKGLPDYEAARHLRRAIHELFEIESLEPIAEQAETATTPQEKKRLATEYEIRTGIDPATREAEKEARLRLIENERQKMDILYRSTVPNPANLETIEASNYERRTPHRIRPSQNYYQAVLHLMKQIRDRGQQPDHIDRDLRLLEVADAYEPLAKAFEMDFNLTPDQKAAIATEYKRHCGFFPSDRHLRQFHAFYSIQFHAHTEREGQDSNQSSGKGESDGG